MSRPEPETFTAWLLYCEHSSLAGGPGEHQSRLAFQTSLDVYARKQGKVRQKWKSVLVLPPAQIDFSANAGCVFYATIEPGRIYPFDDMR